MFQIDIALHRVETANDKATSNRGSILQMGADVIALVTRVTNQDRIIKLLLCDENGKIKRRKPCSQRKKKKDQQITTEGANWYDDKNVTYQWNDDKDVTCKWNDEPTVPECYADIRVSNGYEDRSYVDRYVDEHADHLLYTEENIPPCYDDTNTYLSH